MNLYKSYCPREFKGVLVLLREPNSRQQPAPPGWEKPGQAYYWARRMLTDPAFANEFTGTEKRAVPLYRHKLAALLQQLSPCYRLEDLAYANLHPEKGGTHCARDYQQIPKADRALELVEELSPTVVLTCADIYEALKKKLSPVEERDGLVYATRTHKCFSHKGVTYYSMYHPASSKRIG